MANRKDILLRELTKRKEQRLAEIREKEKDIKTLNKELSIINDNIKAASNALAHIDSELKSKRETIDSLKSDIKILKEEKEDLINTIVDVSSEHDIKDNHDKKEIDDNTLKQLLKENRILEKDYNDYINNRITLVELFNKNDIKFKYRYNMSED